MTRAGQMSGLQQTVLNERHRLIRFLMARGAGDDAEDLLQILWQKVAIIPDQPIADPLSYLFRAAENLMRDMRRSAISREKRQFDWHELTPDNDEQPAGERVLIARQQLQDVQMTLSALGPRAEQIFRRCRVDGIGQAAIAKELGISLSSVEKDLQKAYRALAQLKAKYDAG